MILSCVLVFVLILKYIPNILQKLKDWDWPKKYDFGFKYNRHICTSEHAVFWCVPTPMYFLAVIQLYFPTLSLCTAQITLLQFVPIPMVYICSVEWHENCATWQEKYVLVFQARKWKSKLVYLDCFQNSPGGRKRGKKDSSHCICKQIFIKRLETILEIGMRELHTCLFIIATSLSYYPGKWPLLQVCYKP